MKVKIHLNLLENINFYQCELTTQNMKISTTLGAVTHSAKYCLIIVIDKIPENIEI